MAEQTSSNPGPARSTTVDAMGLNLGFVTSKAGILLAIETVLAVIVLALANVVNVRGVRLSDSYYLLLLTGFYAMISFLFLWIGGLFTKDENKQTLFMVLAQSFTAILYFSSAVAVLATIDDVLFTASVLCPTSKMSDFASLKALQEQLGQGGTAVKPRSPQKTQVEAACAMAIISCLLHAGHAVLGIFGWL